MLWRGHRLRLVPAIPGAIVRRSGSRRPDDRRFSDAGGICPDARQIRPGRWRHTAAWRRADPGGEVGWDKPARQRGPTKAAASWWSVVRFANLSHPTMQLPKESKRYDDKNRQQDQSAISHIAEET